MLLLLHLCNKSKLACPPRSKSLGGGEGGRKVFFLAGEKGTEPLLMSDEGAPSSLLGRLSRAGCDLFAMQIQAWAGSWQLTQNKLHGELAWSFGFTGSSRQAGQADLLCHGGYRDLGKSPCRLELLCPWLSEEERLGSWPVASPAGHCCPLVQAS